RVRRHVNRDGGRKHERGESPMSNAEVEPAYYDLTIVAASPATEIWLGDDCGHLVQKEIGALETSLLPGEYVVEFGLGTGTYPIHLAKASQYTQAEIAAGPTCSRPVPKLLRE
ncbi:MAG: hypothetical protein ACRD3R_04410, partial [Terriglobales bacterium]